MRGYSWDNKMAPGEATWRDDSNIHNTLPCSNFYLKHYIIRISNALNKIMGSGISTIRGSSDLPHVAAAEQQTKTTPLPLPPYKGTPWAAHSQQKCYACDKPTIGGLYCSCIDHLPYGGIYANKELINRTLASED